MAKWIAVAAGAVFAYAVVSTWPESRGTDGYARCSRAETRRLDLWGPKTR